MVEILAIWNCEECGKSYEGKVGIDEGQLIARGVDLNELKLRPNENCATFYVPKCKFHRGLRPID